MSDSQDADSDRIPDDAYRRYVEDYRQLEELEFSESERYDKLLIALSSGAFALSIAFVKEIAPTIKPDTKHLILWAWIFFLSSLVSIIVSLVTSQYGNRHKREVVLQPDGTYKQGDIGLFLYSKATDLLNGFSFFSLLFGAGCLIAFAYFNLDGEPKAIDIQIQQESVSMNGKDNEWVERGKAPSQPPKSAERPSDPPPYKKIGGGKAPSQPPVPQQTKPKK